MSEKNYVVNIKNARGTIFTFRGDTAEELSGNIHGFVSQDLVADVTAVEGAILGVQAAPASAPSALQVVQNAFPDATVVATTPAPQGGFAPVPPPTAAAPAQAGQRLCQHGPMTFRKGQGAKGEWKAFFCGTPKGTVGQCDPQWVTRQDPEWASL